MRVQASLIALGFLIATAALAAPPFVGKGTDIRHLTVRAELEPTGFAPENAEGKLRLMLRQQGLVDVQKLQLWLKGLAGDASHDLFVHLRDVVDPVFVETFVTDADGAARLKLMRVMPKNGVGPIFPGGGGFPAPLDPLVDVLAIEVVDDLEQVVLAVDLGDPFRFQYLVKRALTNDGVDTDAAGQLFLKGHPGKTKFRILAGNLDEPDYALFINDVEIGVFATDADGRLKIKSLPDGAPAALEMRRIELRNALGESVLSTDLP